MNINPSTMNDVRSRLPVAPTEEQHPIQNTNSTYANEIVPKNEKCTFFGQYTSRDETEATKFPDKGRENTFKTIPWHQSQSA